MEYAFTILLILIDSSKQSKETQKEIKINLSKTEIKRRNVSKILEEISILKLKVQNFKLVKTHAISKIVNTVTITVNSLFVVEMSYLQAFCQYKHISIYKIRFLVVFYNGKLYIFVWKST